MTRSDKKLSQAEMSYEVLRWAETTLDYAYDMTNQANANETAARDVIAIATGNVVHESDTGSLRVDISSMRTPAEIYFETLARATQILLSHTKKHQHRATDRDGS